MIPDHLLNYRNRSAVAEILIAIFRTIIIQNGKDIKNLFPL